jgi:hypothetical protein
VLSKEFLAVRIRLPPPLTVPRKPSQLRSRHVRAMIPPRHSLPHPRQQPNMRRLRGRIRVDAASPHSATGLSQATGALTFWWSGYI